MIANKCLFCGSSNLRADRALSGRLVCTSCGKPYGVRKGRSNQLNNFNPFSLKKKNWFLIIILIFVLILILI
tara:strand:- start:255 stop:470 length:216 start_codon:yes stop_codon:yes gene_type:complete